MESNYLCTTQRARHPFHIENIGINIYSAEELCYYLYHNIYLIDETVINERLCDWLGDELGMEKTRALMLRSLNHNEGPESFFTPLFQECRYLKVDEVRSLLEKLSGLKVESDDVRHKMKADYLLRFEMYNSAITEYEKILEKKTNSRLNVQFYAEIMEQAATAYARLFRFEEAADYLWESYQILHSRKTYEKYLKILPLFLSKQRYQERLEEIHAQEEDAQHFREETEKILLEGSGVEERIEDPVEFMEELKQSYIRNTTGTR